MEPMTIQEEYRARHPRSAALAERARAAIPGGITHDIRHLAPFPTYIDRASGTRKWDVAAHGKAASWLGTAPPFSATSNPPSGPPGQGQAPPGTHVGPSPGLEAPWAGPANRLVPC